MQPTLQPPFIGRLRRKGARDILWKCGFRDPSAIENQCEVDLDKNFEISLCSVLTNFPEIQVAFVYGSFATNKATEGSDIDLAIAGLKPLTIEEKLAISAAVESKFDREIDLVDLHAASGTILSEALTTGTPVLLKDPDILAKILSRMITDEEDFQKQRRLASQEIRSEVFSVKR